MPSRAGGVPVTAPVRALERSGRSRLGKCHVRTASTRTTPVPHGSLTPDPRAPGTQPSEADLQSSLPPVPTSQPAGVLPRHLAPRSFRHPDRLQHAVAQTLGAAAPLRAARVVSDGAFHRQRHRRAGQDGIEACRIRPPSTLLAVAPADSPVPPTTVHSSTAPFSVSSMRGIGGRARGCDPEHARLRSGDGFHAHRHRTKPAPVPRGGRWYLRSRAGVGGEACPAPAPNHARRSDGRGSHQTDRPAPPCGKRGDFWYVLGGAVHPGTPGLPRR